MLFSAYVFASAFEQAICWGKLTLLARVTLACVPPRRKVCVCVVCVHQCLHIRPSPHTPVGLCFMRLQLSTRSVPWCIPRCKTLALSHDVTQRCFARRAKIATKWGGCGWCSCMFVVMLLSAMYFEAFGGVPHHKILGRWGLKTQDLTFSDFWHRSQRN